MNTEEQRAAGFDQFIEMLDSETRHWWLKEFSEAFKVADAAYGKDGRLNSWYANCILTDPPHQGKRYGTLMVQAGLKRAAEDRTIAALATYDKPLVDWYVHLGFKPIATADIKGPRIDPQVGFNATWFTCDDPERHV
ncbi:uncharacterized protein PHACADRAFT_257577 [Phanerochaete carnosa HHB-10118-sp]|uniref:N-acetyltransferase domain-containing protein n=1 Tax=Phanerochaete carnosa (strain HHB-10118-sp) TaxID=650164 RepID=K5VRA4_PHACS|nr:uncharacterized protein PHACADRAFT_257577 [Phanerochaete carnosa HHB-10118-sp]EKM54008.1 hypothetical protein PHACADRAFT_257577 [Phanerochaete carnosa HHB-10118-sp]